MLNWNFNKWDELHRLAVEYPENPNDEQKRNMYNFLKNMYNYIKCKRCKEHTKKYIENYLSIETCETQDNLFKFFVDFHNDVNKNLGKSQISYKSAYELYKI